MSNQEFNDWSEMVEQMNEAVAQSIEQNAEAQAAFVESWSDAVGDSMLDEDELSEGIEGYAAAWASMFCSIDCATASFICSTISLQSLNS